MMQVKALRDLQHTTAGTGMLQVAIYMQMGTHKGKLPSKHQLLSTLQLDPASSTHLVEADQLPLFPLRSVSSITLTFIIRHHCHEFVESIKLLISVDVHAGPGSSNIAAGKRLPRD